MEKIIFAIIILNIIASIYTKRKKQKKLEETAAARKPSGKKNLEKGTVPESRSAPAKPAPFKQHIKTGKSLFQEFIKELGIETPEEEDQFVRDPEIQKKSKLPPALEKVSPPVGPLPGTVQTVNQISGVSKKNKSLSGSYIKSQLKKSSSVKTAIILKTILDKPKALQAE